MAKRKRDSPPRPRFAEYLKDYRYGIQSQPGGQNIGPRNAFARTPVWDEIPPVTPRSSTLQIGDEHVHKGASYKQYTLSAQPHFEDDNKEDNNNEDDDNKDDDNGGHDYKDYDNEDYDNEDHDYEDHDHEDHDEELDFRLGQRYDYSQDEEEEDKKDEDKKEEHNADILMGLVFQSKVEDCEAKVSCCYLVAEGSRCIVRVVDGGSAVLLHDIMVLLGKLCLYLHIRHTLTLCSQICRKEQPRSQQV